MELLYIAVFLWFFYDIFIKSLIEAYQIRKARRKGDECICEGNWRNLVKDYDPLIGRKFRCLQDKDVYTFFGLVHANDDYYYGLWREGNMVLSSCVGRLEDHYELIDQKKGGW